MKTADGEDGSPVPAKGVVSGARVNSVSEPPLAAQKEHREEYHGTIVNDPYYWLRNRKDPEVMAYLEAENAYTEAQTRHLSPLIDELYSEMLSRIEESDQSVPVRDGPYLYYTRVEKGQEYKSYCRRPAASSGPENQEQVLLDLNILAEGRSFIGVGAFSVSDDGNLLAFTVDKTGYRQYVLQIKNLLTGELLPGRVPRVTSLEWASDNSTLFLTTEDERTKRSDTLQRYAIGAPAAEPVYYEPDPFFDLQIERTRDRKFLILTIGSKDTTEQRILPRDRPNARLELFLERQKGHRYYFDHREGELFIRTNHDGRTAGSAKDFRVVKALPGDRSPSEWVDFVPHRPGTLIERIELFSKFAAVFEKTRAMHQLRVFRFSDQSWTRIESSEAIFRMTLGENPEFDSINLRYSLESFVTPPSVYDFDILNGQSHLLKRQAVAGGYDPARYTSERLWITVRDGTKVPLTIAYRDDRRIGPLPTLLYGYGSYGVGVDIIFSSNRISLLDRGMLFAVAHIRGGDELGEQWRVDGMLMKKKNTFNDFIDCAEHLIARGWTCPDKLAIEGRSAGGLLMGAVVNMRPELFRAVHLAVPFVDVVNTMMDPTLPLTSGEYLEWGDPNEREAYSYMHSYSPYDNLKPRKYPAMLVTTSLNDSQVMYWEPAKYVAKLRKLKADNRELLLKIRIGAAGHGGVSGRYNRLRELAFEYAWLLKSLEIA